ncbi:MAG: alpha-L-fucosidase [Bacteroidales bacterium]|nr:alpha-L-fucosidase [Bacteroidales bacterium]
MKSFVYSQGAKFNPTWESLDSRPIPGWFSEAGFGIFIHWGVYSVPSWRALDPKRYGSYAEWYYARVMDNKENGGYEFHRKNYGEDFEYRDFAPFFRAELFDPDAWAVLFRNSGAKYVVLTSKHHDGFCLWPTENPHKKGWNAGDTGPHRDLLGDLASAVRKAGLRMGLYYSIPDWESIPKNAEGEFHIHKKYVDKYGLSPEVYAREVCIPQLYELVNKYNPSLIFSDGGEWLYDEDFWQTKEFLAWLYSDSPVKDEVVVNDRWCRGMPGKHGDYFSSEYKDAEGLVSHKYWEESRGIGGSYGFNRAENLEDYNTSEELVHELIDIVSRGGNLLLNIGPTADGRIPVIMQQRLTDMGKWLEVNGEAIYGTLEAEGYKQKNREEQMFFTRKQNVLYCLLTFWQDEEFTVYVLPGDKAGRIEMLGASQPVEWRQEGEKLFIRLPCLSVNRLPCQYAWGLKISW